MPKKLTLKQRQFANEYIANRGNATKAVLKTYDTDNGPVFSVYLPHEQRGQSALALPSTFPFRTFDYE